MKLMLCNGSPRGKTGNTAILLKHFSGGFAASGGENEFEIAFLNRVADHADVAARCRKAGAVIIAFPLYADSMPAVVKDFIETLGPGDSFPPLGFIVQSGFPEAVHSRAVERYLEKLARRLGARYIGTVVRGGVEGIQVMPPLMTRRLFMAFRALGRHFAVTREFHPRIVKSLAGRERFSIIGRLVFRMMRITGIAHYYWNSMLKRHGAYARRFDRPYAPGADNNN